MLSFIVKGIKVTHTKISTQASELLRDMTLGANMRVHLVRMIILSEPEVSGLLLQLMIGLESSSQMTRC